MGLKNDKGALKMADERLIAALDFHDMDEVKALVNKLGDSVNYYKVGMELYYSVGRESVTWLKEKGKKVFLDLKLHDIPNTVGSGLCSLMDLGADMLNVHAEGGYTMMKTAADRLRRAAEEANVPCPKLIAVTVLTSISEDEWAGLGFSENVQIRDIVVHLARLAQKAGLDGVVASPVTPGVRPAGSSLDDQSRIATPASALRAGATHLVIGRPIRAAENPVKAAQDIIKEMEQVK